MTKNKKYGLSRSKSLKSKILIDLLFKQGKSISKFPVRLVYLETDYDKDEKFQVAFSVPKKKFKKAVERNRIKRLMREAFRLQQHNLPAGKKLIMMWIYTGKDIPDYRQVFSSVQTIIETLKNNI